MSGEKIYDVAVAGAGVVGSLIARELSKYNVTVAILEKEEDVASGTTKANSAIVHAGFDAETGTLKAKLNVQGCKIMPSLAKDLHVPFIKNGSLVCAFGEKEAEHVEILLERGRKNGVANLEIIKGERLFEIEPNLSKEVTAALYASDAGIVCPYELTVAAVENACENGAELILGFKVCDIKSENGVISISNENGKEIKTRCFINSAGLYADEIAEMCGDKKYTIIPRRGEYMLMDKKAGSAVKNTLFAVPSEQGKGILVSPTVDGNLILGPNAREVDKDNVLTTKEGLAEIEQGAKRLIPDMNMRLVITSFAGVRSTPKNHDFNIEFSENMKNVLHLVGIESPGLASSPAIAVYVADMLKNNGVELVPKESFNPKRIKNKPFREMNEEERQNAVKENPLYSKIICRCETVTEAEIVDAIKSGCPAKNVDAVKKRTRAGMGRCQGGFCSPRVVEILSRELGIDMTEVTKNGRKSYILTGKTK